MNQALFNERVNSIIQEVLETEAFIADDKNLDEIGLNSMKFIELVIKCEESFQFDLDDAFLLKEYFETPYKIKSTLQSHQNLMKMLEG